MIFCADLHLGKVSDTIEKEYNGIFYPSRTVDTIFRLKELIYISSKGDKTFIIGGDVFDSPRPAPWIIGLLFDVFHYAKERNVKIYIISGNHDCDVKWSNLIIFYKAEFPNVEIISDIKSITIRSVKIGFIPHLPRSEKEYIEKTYGSVGECAKEFLGDYIPILISHAHMKGVKNSSDVEIEAGNALEFIPDEFPRFDIACFGHIHNSCSLVHVCQDNNKMFQSFVFYPGSVVPCDYGEINSKRGYLDVNLDTKEVVFKEFQTPITEYYHVKIDLVNKDTVTFDPEKVKIIAEGKLIKITVYTDSILKVNEKDIKEVFSKVGTVTRFEIKIPTKSVVENDLEIEEGPEKIISYNEYFKQWIDSNSEINSDIKPVVLAVGCDIIDEVMIEEQSK